MADRRSSTAPAASSWSYSEDFVAEPEGLAGARERATEIGPPAPITPGNMMPVFINPEEKAKEVEFAWTPMANAAGYRLRISHNPYFSSLLLDRKVETPSVVVTGLPVGAYYWSIQSYDAAGKES